jgi:hypothetical protein
MPSTRATLSSLFSTATKSCPSEITSYATCVAAAHDSDKLAKGACEAQFVKLRKCFAKVRGLKR